MTTQALADPRAPASWRALRTAVAPLAVGVLALALIFHAEIVAAIGVWIDSTAYNHCFLVLPIVGYLIWDRRAVLAGAVPHPWPQAALLALPVGAVWFLADRIGIMEGRQLTAMSLVELLLLGVLGWRLYRALLGPLLYLYFLVPFGAFITPQLQDVTAWFTTHGLDLLGIPNFSDGYTIEIPEGSFYIAEACAGLRFLIAAVAFGCLYSLLMYRSAGRRAVFILVSIVVPVIANGFRALGIVTLGHILGSAKAAATDHVLYGWLFFSIVILVLVILGLPFREDGSAPVPLPPDRDATPPSGSGRAVAALLAVALAGPLVAVGFDHASAAALPALWPAVPADGCAQTAPTERFLTYAPGRLVVLHLSCGGADVVVQAEMLSPRTDPGTIVAEQRRLLGLSGDLIETVPFDVDGTTWRLTVAGEPARAVAYSLWMGGRRIAFGLRLRLLQGWRSIVGSTAVPVVLVVTPNPNLLPDDRTTARAQAAIGAYLHRQPGLAWAIARMSAAAVRPAQAARTE